jgi:glucose-1-phosphate cytidylyltransferase
VRRYFAEHEHPSWDVTLVDTGTLSDHGSQVEKGTRIARVADYLTGDRFFVAYGEAVADINLDDLVAFHEQHGKRATVTGVRARCQYGVFDTGADNYVSGFVEKPQLPYWINGGFMLFERPALDLMRGGNVDLERHVLSRLAKQNELMLYRHSGYWQSMKTLKDAMALREAWKQHKAWKVWEE